MVAALHTLRLTDRLFVKILKNEVMEIEKSRNGYYTVTFTNKTNLDEQEILREFSTVGRVCKIVKNFQRIFVRFKEKEEAERALQKFGKVYDINMAKNNGSSSDIHHTEGGGGNQNQKQLYNNAPYALPTHEIPSLVHNMEKLNSTNRFFHLILANLPKNYTVEDVKTLIEEAKPVYINHLQETRVFSIKFCHIILNSMENLTYLIDKLNGFVIGGEKLIAAEVKHLLEWKEKAV